MEGLIICYYHLKSHAGVKRMLIELSDFYFPKMYSKIKHLISICYVCSLENPITRLENIGNYPIPDYPFQVISLDLAENLNKVKGYENLLIAVCNLTDFTFVFPLKTKTAKEVMYNIIYGILLTYPVEKILTDNGKAFRRIKDLINLKDLRIKVLNTSALHPAAKGRAEVCVKTVKTVFKKILNTAKHDTYDWTLLPYIATKILNTTKSTKSKYTPFEQVFGTNYPGAWILGNPLNKGHTLLLNKAERVKLLSDKTEQIIQSTKKLVQNIREKQNQDKNKNKITREFKTNEIVFVKDNQVVEGASRPLRLRYDRSPYVIEQVLHTTVVCRRLSDGMKFLYSKNMLKKYIPNHSSYDYLPQEVRRALLVKFEDISMQDFSDIAMMDNMTLPPALHITKLADDEIVITETKEHTEPLNLDPPPDFDTIQDEPEQTQDLDTEDNDLSRNRLINNAPEPTTTQPPTPEIIQPLRSKRVRFAPQRLNYDTT